MHFHSTRTLIIAAAGSAQQQRIQIPFLYTVLLNNSHSGAVPLLFYDMLFSEKCVSNSG